jgi:glutamyl-tRNA synthetase
MTQPLRVRMAPSPTGDLHVGSARTALFNYLMARRVGGAFVLRIEDTDAQRSDPTREAGIFDGLRWLGLNWDEGPDVGGPYGPYRQSERTDVHREAVQQLVAGGHAYYDYTTAEERAEERERQRAEGQPQRYSGMGRDFTAAEIAERRAAGVIPAVRFRHEPQPVRYEDVVLGSIQVGPDDIDDFVIARGDGSALYNMAVVVDDHHMKISHVVRGKDHVSNTFRQVLLYEALGWTPPVFAHLPLVVNRRRQKFSKRDGAQWVGEYRTQGYLPEALANFLIFLGWAPGDEREIFSLDELVQEFRLERVNRADAVFDPQRLDHFNGVWIRRMDLEDLADRAWPYAVDGGLDLDAAQRAYFTSALALEFERLSHLNRTAELMDFFFDDDLDPDMGQVRFRRHSPAETAGALERVAVLVDEADPFDDPTLEAAMRTLATDLNWKAGDLFMPVRIAVTGRRATPPLFATMEVLGRRRCRSRLQRALAGLAKLAAG